MKGIGSFRSEPGFQAGQPQGQVKLIAGPFAHRGGQDRLAVGPHAGQDLLAAIVEIDPQGLERTERQPPEEVARPAEHGPFVLLAIALDPFAQNGRGQPQAQVVLHVGLQPGKDILGVLGRFGRRGAGVHAGQDCLLAADRSREARPGCAPGRTSRRRSAATRPATSRGKSQPPRPSRPRSSPPRQAPAVGRGTPPASCRNRRTSAEAASAAGSSSGPWQRASWQSTTSLARRVSTAVWACCRFSSCFFRCDCKRSKFF